MPYEKVNLITDKNGVTKQVQDPEAYVMPINGIPATDLEQDAQDKLGLAGTAIQPSDIENAPEFVEELDSVEGLQDEWADLRNDVYQALTDAQAVTEQATTAKNGANSAADFANSAATAANNAATNANEKATLANQAATAANNAAAAVEDAKGDFDTLDERLDYIEANAGDLEFVEDNTDNCPFG